MFHNKDRVYYPNIILNTIANILKKMRGTVNGLKMKGYLKFNRDIRKKINLLFTTVLIDRMRLRICPFIVGGSKLFCCVEETPRPTKKY